MSEILSIVLTSGLTIFGGVVVFAASQLVAKFAIEPAHELSQLMGEIGDSLVFYANVYTNPGIGDPERMDETSEKLRQQASQVRAKAHAVRWYDLWQSVGLVPNRMDILEASRKLVGLSNSIHRGDALRNDETAREIQRLLRLEISID